MIAQSRRAAAAAGLVAPAFLFAACGGGAPGTAPAARTLLVSDRGGAARIYEMDEEAGSVTLVGSDDAAGTTSIDAMPARLPDGRILFVSTRAGAPALYVAASGSAGARPLFAASGGAVSGGALADAAATPAADSDPAPCGADRVLFARAPAAGTPRDLWIAGIDGSGARALTRAASDDGAPCLMPDRRTVVFISDRDGTPRLYRLDLQAGDPEASVRPIDTGATAPGTIDAAPACLPDGSILFARGAAGGPSQVMVLATGATPPVLRQVTDAQVLPYGAGEPVAIGDGKFLLTAGPGKGPGGRPRYGIYRVTTGGYNLTRITRDGVGYSDYARGLMLLR